MSWPAGDDSLSVPVTRVKPAILYVSSAMLFHTRETDPHPRTGVHAGTVRSLSHVHRCAASPYISFDALVPCLVLLMMHHPHPHQPWRLSRCDSLTDHTILLQGSTLAGPDVQVHVEDLEGQLRVRMMVVAKVVLMGPKARRQALKIRQVEAVLGAQKPATGSSSEAIRPLRHPTTLKLHRHKP